MSPTTSTGRAALPIEPRSTSELLSATHLFSVEVLDAKPSAWAVQAEGLEQRSVRMKLRLSSLSKGRLVESEGTSFSATVEQRRESELVGEDYQGLWSHVTPEPAPGARYLVVSVTPEGSTSGVDAARLLQEDACRMLLPIEQTADVALAGQAESLYRERLSEDRSDPQHAASELIAFAGAHGAEADGPFARYLWARISAPLSKDGNGLRGEYLALLSKPEISPGVRLELLVDLERALPDLEEAEAGFGMKAGRALAGMLLEPGAAHVRQRIADVSLHFLVFPDEVHARFAAADLIPDAARRTRIAEALGHLPGPHAAQLRSWLIQ